ncbi:acyltransferase [Candidatus Leptofilum sp.]|uniref:acyltransferase n=1 Tax=Candidatus Leptofilum sp. TaxID=3241576 RepID=UPI003B5BAAEE
MILKLRRFLRTLLFGWQFRSILTYLAGHGPNLDLFNFYYRPWLLRWAGAKIADSVAIMPGIEVTQGKLTVGKEVFINSDCRLACGGGIEIGTYCQISPRVSFETVGHALHPVEDGKRGSESAPIKVEDHAWIGTGVILLPGVTVGEGAVVAAGAVVTKDVPAQTVVAGVPARVIRHLSGHSSVKRPSPPKQHQSPMTYPN